MCTYRFPQVVDVYCFVSAEGLHLDRNFFFIQKSEMRTCRFTGWEPPRGILMPSLTTSRAEEAHRECQILHKADRAHHLWHLRGKQTSIRDRWGILPSWSEMVLFLVVKVPEVQVLLCSTRTSMRAQLVHTHSFAGSRAQSTSGARSALQHVGLSPLNYVIIH